MADNQALTPAQERIHNALQARILTYSQYQGELSLHVKPEDLFAVMKQLKEEFGFNYFVDMGTIDHYTDTGRFEVFYNIYNLAENIRLRVKCRVEEDHPEVDSLIELWPAANWNEREAFDMMGIRFKGHPDMRRMFMPEDFEYFPHRKEFPLIGIPGSIQMPEKEPPKGYR